MATLAQRLRAGEPIITAWAGLPDPLLTGHILQEDFDAITLDMQHGLFEPGSTALAIAQAYAFGKPAIVRVPIADFAGAARMLDAGAAAIIAPMINSAAEASAFVDHVKFAPAGSRSWGPAIALNHWRLTPAEYLRQANDECLAIAMIETRAALTEIDQILAVPGLDGVFFGPSDMSIAITKGQTVDAGADLDGPAQRMADRARAAGKLACGFAADGARAAALLAKGYHLVSVGTEVSHLRAGARQMIAAARKGL